MISIDGRTMILCTVTDLSESGVRLTMATTVGVPDVFLLHAPGFGSGVCEVAWRSEAALGGRLTCIAAW
nr:PilZ domain-containing protein [Methylobacterium dankookense]